MAESVRSCSVRSTLLASAAAILTVSLPAAAHAQDSGAAAETSAAEQMVQGEEQSSSDDAATAAANEASGDIVVTAQRRRERLQDVPLSVSAVTGETLKNAAVTNVERLEQLIPGVRFGRSGAALRPAIRGTYTENVAVNGDPRIAVYVDEIYQSRPQQIPPLVDIDRVEVQKGPQGTLYGRNSFGGNIVFNSVVPSDRFTGSVDALYENYNHWRIEGALNLPITDGIALRLAGLGEESDGYIKNINPNGNDAGDDDQYFARGTLRIAPPGMERLEVLLRGSYLWQGGAGVYGFGYKEVGVLVDQSLIRQPGQSLTRNGVTYTFPNGFNGQSWTGQPLPLDSRFRDGIADVGGVDIGIPVDPDPYRVNFEGPTIRRTNQYQYSGAINYDAGFANLRSITSYTDFNNLVTGNTLTPIALSFSYIRTKAKTFTQELQILSNDSTSPFQYIVGGYYYDDTITEHNVTNLNRAYNTFTAPAGQQYYTFGFTAFPTLATSPTSVGNGFNQQFGFDSFSAFRQKIESLAGYAQLSYTFAEKLTVTGGIRYTSDRKEQMASRFNTSPTGGTGPSYYVHSIDDPVNYQCGGVIAANAASNANAATIANAYNFVCADLEQNFTTYRAAVDYKFDRNHMVYASYSTGAHSGGFNTGVLSFTPGTFTLLPFAPEYVEAFELGTKNTWMNGALRLNAAIFLNRYTDLQAQTSIPNPVNPSAVLALVQNIGEDEAYGLDLEAVVRPDDHLTISIAYNYLHAREKDYAVNTFNFGGLAAFCNVAGTPQGTFNSLGGCTSASGEQNTVQGTPFPNARTDPNRFIPVLDASGNPVITNGVPQLLYVIAGRGRDGTVYESRKAFQPDHVVQIGAAYRIDLAGGASITPEAHMYFSSDYILTDLTPDFGNQESFTRTDLRITYRSADDRFRIQAFVNNLENEAVIGRAVYAAHRTLQAHYAKPRTYGVSAGFRF